MKKLFFIALLFLSSFAFCETWKVGDSLNIIKDIIVYASAIYPSQSTDPKQKGEYFVEINETTFGISARFTYYLKAGETLTFDIGDNKKRVYKILSIENNKMEVEEVK